MISLPLPLTLYILFPLTAARALLLKQKSDCVTFSTGSLSPPAESSSPVRAPALPTLLPSFLPLPSLLLSSSPADVPAGPPTHQTCPSPTPTPRPPYWLYPLPGMFFP